MTHVPTSFDVGSVTHAGRVRERNEDSFLVRTDVGLWAVADGMGGHEAGDLASRVVVQSLDAIGSLESAADLLAECEVRLFSANQQILALSQERQGATVGTTAAVLLVRDGYYACVWAGDSRVYLISRGIINQVSHDHSELEELIAEGALSREDVKDWPNNAITRAVGVADDPEFEVVTGPAAPEDIFVICSDGLTKHVQDEEILQHAATRRAQAACDDMLALALDRGGLDNVTIVIVRLLAPQSREPTRSPLDWKPQS
ncbi:MULTISPECIES: PP2C family serine/threonine-protein phosphatase [unclassified Bradyrhizobium]|uniref:PP2C family protein-serine/threonine phosphatase n=1 Tax=unclassified Bradyrhizobium TaxID=2631580 RepID=UPI0008EA3F9B|nr:MULTISPECIES: protein phosphatase 2C domain-containing protein [unclassified Bradyrhizobium]MBB4256125.1 protein phosphatase [Bradyrhizobium sp. CIR3A]MBB4381143.1 protein phosphatase [Bradyrhizobium sp. SBR1B]MBB4392359.1 protein phosphatase [Bradyrhizobium sp. ERR14]NYG48294.1 protein phosphatase [Bradyrhizobium sp. IAR9]SFN18473.1 protein phosphatase [Bradyrhizobium sp. Rc3b]